MRNITTVLLIRGRVGRADSFLRWQPGERLRGKKHRAWTLNALKLRRGLSMRWMNWA